MDGEVVRAFPACSPHNYFKTLAQLPASPPDSWPWLPPGHSLASLHRRFSQRLERCIWNRMQRSDALYNWFIIFSPSVLECTSMLLVC